LVLHVTAIFAGADRAHDACLDAGVLSSDFVRTARQRSVARHGDRHLRLRNAMLPVITALGMVFSFLLGANVLVERYSPAPASALRG
jgi:ABC-type dipeptide/oligopeptide/nickel transport system permease component